MIIQLKKKFAKIAYTELPLQPDGTEIEDRRARKNQPRPKIPLAKGRRRIGWRWNCKEKKEVVGGTASPLEELRRTWKNHLRPGAHLEVRDLLAEANVVLRTKVSLAAARLGERS